MDFAPPPLLHPVLTDLQVQSQPNSASTRGVSLAESVSSARAAPVRKSAAVSYLRPVSAHDRNDSHDRYESSLIYNLRKEPVSALAERRLSRPSSSSGSTWTLRPTERNDHVERTSPASRLRSSSAERLRSTASPVQVHRRAASVVYPSPADPHPALRISKRTHAAVLYALEEALRAPNLFTPDLEEENAQMSDLGSGRATNGGSRSTGPVPVSTSATAGIRTPRDVMRDRTAREARRLEEQKAEEQRRLAEERRRSAERRAEGMAGVPPSGSNIVPQYNPELGTPTRPDVPSDRRSRTVAGAAALGRPLPDYTPSRRRTDNTQDQSRLAQPAVGSRRTQQSQPVPRQPAASTSAAGTASGPAGTQSQTTAAQGATVSSFPHAFERWENLSAHWEGMTSYWLHKLEQNTEEIRSNVPNASTLNRQITDLSAAGANLFHAVVELQRLRASSERKFQRWFFETRADTERNQELQAQVDKQLQVERSAREEAAQKRAEAEEAATIARQEVAEMQRELMISKDEARRAWEELGRRNQESLETADSLKNGRITVVAGLQVVPYFGGPSRTESASQRPATRGEDPQQQYYSTVPAQTRTENLGQQNLAEEQDYYRRELSPTNTDPFTEVARERPGSASSRPIRGQAEPSVSQRSPAPQPATSPQAQSFYQQAPDQRVTSVAAAPSQLAPPPPNTRAQTRPGQDMRSEQSYADTISEGDTEYAIDPSGNIRLDAHGRPVVFRRRGDTAPSENLDDESMPIRYEGVLPPEAPTVPSTSAQAMATYSPTSTSAPAETPAATAPAPDYEGSGYGGWEAVQTRHHHPTRLSDVLEEEEERSSRRTVE